MMEQGASAAGATFDMAQFLQWLAERQEQLMCTWMQQQQESQVSKPKDEEALTILLQNFMVSKTGYQGIDSPLLQGGAEMGSVSQPPDSEAHLQTG
ncbi:UNVERIFIED_CONTAM: hypothetical protein K2H54_048453 [Gekko kuhli]